LATPLEESVVHHVAALARLRLTHEEELRLAEQLAEILGFFQQLNELDTRDVPPTAHPLPVVNVFREDAAREGWPAEIALANAPKRQQDFFHVPKVLDQEHG
jgi:aspartyl-tRNA(Asn)/glutamyl-tRNA(Gln) amidotransferase subunit C